MSTRAYLTIDDSPSATMDDKLEALLDRDIPAVWFCLGDSLESNPAPALRAIEGGHLVGNHSYSHERFSDRSLERCLEEIDRTDAIIDELYARADVERPTKAFRFPYGDEGSADGADPEKAAAIQSALRDLGYAKPAFDGISYDWYRNGRYPDDVDWFWTVDTRDWELEVLEDVLAWIDDGGRDGRLHRPASDDIVLVHDHDETAAWFESTVDRLLECGVTFAAPVQGRRRRRR